MSYALHKCRQCQGSYTVIIIIIIINSNNLIIITRKKNGDARLKLTRKSDKINTKDGAGSDTGTLKAALQNLM